VSEGRGCAPFRSNSVNTDVSSRFALRRVRHGHFLSVGGTSLATGPQRHKPRPRLLYVGPLHRPQWTTVYAVTEVRRWPERTSARFKARPPHSSGETVHQRRDHNRALSSVVGARAKVSERRNLAFQAVCGWTWAAPWCARSVFQSETSRSSLDQKDD
jgi:hypothetical protein